jgi:hypothetical protein
MAFRAAEYERFRDTRSRVPAWWPICTATWRRGWSSRWVRLITWGVLAMSFGLTAMFYFAYQVMPNWPSILRMVGEEGGLESGFPIQFYEGLLVVFVYPVLLPLALLFGYDLVSKDLASNALETYFSRPVTPLVYVVGRTLAYVGFLLLVTLLPMLWIWLFDASTGPEGRFEEIRGVPLALAEALGLVSLVLALLVQALSSITRSGIWTNLAFVVLFVFSTATGNILYEESGRRIEVELSPEEVDAAMALPGSVHVDGERATRVYWGERDARLLALSFPNDIAAWCTSRIERAYPDEVIEQREERRKRRRRDDRVPDGLATQVLLAAGGLSLLLLFLRLRKRGTVG